MRASTSVGLRSLRADRRRWERRRIDAGGCSLDTPLDLDILPAVCALIVQVFNLGTLLSLVAAARVVLQLESLEVRPIRVLVGIAAIPVGQATGPDDGAGITAVADRPDAELDLHWGLGPLVGGDCVVTDAPSLANDVVNGEVYIRWGPVDAVCVGGGKGGAVEAVGCVVGVEQGLAVEEVVCLCLVFKGAEEFLCFCVVNRWCFSDISYKQTSD